MTSSGARAQASFICVSLNPAIDKRLRLDALNVGRVNRATEAIPAPGGKSAHVAMVLRALGADPLWLGFSGGPNGDALLQGLRALSIRAEGVPTAAETRMNLEILEENGSVTEILEPGVRVSAAERESLLRAFETALELNSNAFVIMSGSLPPGVLKDEFATLVKIARRHDARIFLDTSGEPLKLGLQQRPDFAKPNQEEAEWLIGKTIDGNASAASALEALVKDGPRNAAISLGASGLVWRGAGSSNAFVAVPPKLEARSAVGSGDATIAGFAFAASQNLGPEDTLRLAVACGAANVLADLPGRVRMHDVERLRDQVQVQALR
ncbi:MAG TPA: 1-phosphofructokinase family hexose kinase [Chthoniobacterales bacterium]|jgi:1-phosphofructokinase family hexose kinase|nr:1-phosphofructokinase family hexose kinase [Chthoniobacterales bacterium]